MKNLIPAIIIATSIIIYGFMQIYASNAQRYQLHEAERFNKLVRIVFDKRTGVIYHAYGTGNGSYFDVINGKSVKRNIRMIAPENDGE